MEFTKEYINKNGQNENLVRKLKSIQLYLDGDLPEWKQLIAIGGFIIDVIRELKWAEQPLFSKMGEIDKEPVMTYSEIYNEILYAVNQHLLVPLADELNLIWHEWNEGKTKKYQDIQNIEEMDCFLFTVIEKMYPGIEQWMRYYYLHEDENVEKAALNLQRHSGKNVLGNRIRKIRQMQGLTQAELGVAIEFGENTAGVRVAQYEQGARNPNMQLKKKLASVLQVSLQAFCVSDIADTMQLLFALEDIHGIKIKKEDGKFLLQFEDNELQSLLKLWWEKQEEIRFHKITRNMYDFWRYRFSENEE